MPFVHVAAWILFLAVSVLLEIVGVPLVAYAAWRGRVRMAPSRDPLVAGEIPVWAARWLFPFGNDDDGIDYPAFVNGRPSGSRPGSRWWRLKWYLRNPVENLRYLPILGFRPDVARIRARGNCNVTPDYDGPLTGLRWSYVWQGAYAGLWLRMPARWAFRIGWKLIPADVRGISQFDGRAPGMPFAFQISIGSHA